MKRSRAGLDGSVITFWNAMKQPLLPLKAQDKGAEESGNFTAS